MNMKTRRSFLSLVAAAFAVRPEDLDKHIALVSQPPVAVRKKPGHNPLIPNWWEHWTIADTVAVEPGAGGVSEILFSAPIPKNMVIESIRWITEAEISCDNLLSLLADLECRLTVDGRPLFAAALGSLGCAPPSFQGGPPDQANNTNRAPFYPRIAPREDLRLEVVGRPSVDRITRVMFALDGTLAIS
jgi:hypothetical protein